jgi:hypothetical protein
MPIAYITFDLVLRIFPISFANISCNHTTFEDNIVPNVKVPSNFVISFGFFLPFYPWRYNNKFDFENLYLQFDDKYSNKSKEELCNDERT